MVIILAVQSGFTPSGEGGISLDRVQAEDGAQLGNHPIPKTRIEAYPYLSACEQVEAGGNVIGISMGANMRSYDEADLKAVSDELTLLREDIAMRGDRPNRWRAAVASLEAKAETIERCLRGYHPASRGPVPGRQRQMIELGVPCGTGFEARLERSRGEAKR